MLFALALALRCFALTAPLLDYHSWRQADTAAIARNFVAGGYRFLYPQVDWGGLTPGYVESEFPLYSMSLALLTGVFGDQPWPGRLLSAVAGAGAVVALSGMAGAVHGRRVGLYAGLALAVMPFAIYFGRTVMPDAWMLLAAILAIWTFQRWLAAPSPGRFLLALVCGALAPLAKTPNLLIVGVPLAYLVLVYRAVPARLLHLLLYGVAFVLPSLLWLNHARGLPLDPRLSFGIGEKLFEPRLLVDPHFYRLLAEWSVTNVLTLAGLPFFLLGLWPSRSFHFGFWILDFGLRWPASEHGKYVNPGRQVQTVLASGAENRPAGTQPVSFTTPLLLPHAWLLGVILFLVAGAAGVVGQDYYILPLAAPAAWLVGIGLDRAQALLATWWGNRRTGEPGRRGDPGDRLDRGQSGEQGSAEVGAILASARGAGGRAIPWAARHYTALLPVLAFVLLATWSFWRIGRLYQTADFYQTLGQRLDLALPPGARIGVIAPAVSEILYYGRRKGWRLDPGVIVPGGLASLGPDLGVRYVLIADPWLTERRPVLEAALREYRRLPVGPYALLLDLAQPGITQPFALAWETGHIVEEPFLSAWQAAGGVAGLGYPLSDALDGPEGVSQFFEREVLVRDGTGARRAPTGRLLLAAQGLEPTPAQVSGDFRTAWEAAGGTMGLGDALSPVIMRPGVSVQYFEYGTLEALPGAPPTRGACGRQLLEARGFSEEWQIEQARSKLDNSR